MHGGSIRFALSTAGVNAWLSSDAAWPWPEKPPWVSRSVVRLLKALPEAAGRRDRRGTVLTLPVFLLQCGTDCQPAEEKAHRDPHPPSPCPPTHGETKGTQETWPLTGWETPLGSNSPRWLALLPGGQWRQRLVLGLGFQRPAHQPRNANSALSFSETEMKRKDKTQGKGKGEQCEGTQA